MKLLRSGVIALAVWLAGMMPAPAALAQTGLFSKDYSWGALQAGQCYAIFFIGDRLEISWAGNDIRYSWSGGCDSEGLITGQGKLTTEFWTPPSDWNPSRTNYRLETTGSASQGMFTGMTSEATFSDADDWNDATPPGTMQWHDFGDVRNPMPSFYQNGCSYFVDGNGQADLSEPSFGCDPGGGQRLLAAMRAGDMSYFAGGEDETAGGSSEPAPPEPSANASGGTVSGALGAAAGLTGAPGACARTPDETLALFDRDFGALTAARPLPPGAGARDTYQYSYYLGVEGLKLLDPYRGCLGPHEAPNDTQLREMVKAGKTGCEALSTSAATCVPQYPF
ncbi:hypothetical protein [Hyphomonas sp.]|uniref:hypothetical protein n=1 Tax=Hyphomonas sp. TaxID=87 RepID=UPI00391C402C